MTLLTPENTALVTDSTADPNDRWPEKGITVVPLTVLWGDEHYDDGIDLTQPQFFERLVGNPVLPTSSQPSAERFRGVYQELTDRYEHVISVHISGLLSGTIESATSAAAEFPQVHVFDSKNTCVGLGIQVERIWERLQAGAELEDLLAYVQRQNEGSAMVILAGTLEYLRRGGRIGRAQEMVGGVLGIRPVIDVCDGVLCPWAKVRGERRAWEAMGRYVAEYHPGEKVYLALCHTAFPEGLERLREAVLAARPDAEIVFSGWAGAVVGVHIGPGTVAIGLSAE
jgi:fatty acid kinase fatty acid binding subunit